MTGFSSAPSPHCWAGSSPTPSRNVQQHLAHLTAEATGEDSGLNAREERIAHRTGANAYPIGGGVFLAVVFLAIMSILYFN